MADLTSVEVLVVGGGGAGGQDQGGGGGGGGVIHEPTYLVIPGEIITVTVGAGGQRPTNVTNVGSGTTAQGKNSTFGTLLAYGGGAGAGAASPNAAGSGGSGGGAGGGRTAGLGVAPQGFAGAATGSGVGGGGGGAGGPGSITGIGGPGIENSITGVPVYYGGGGGGTDENNAAANGGQGGGGTNGGFQASVNNGVNGRGGGGSGYSGQWGGAGNGGSGIVIVRYPAPQRATGGDITISAGYVLHTFSAVGTTTFSPEYSPPAATVPPNLSTLPECQPVSISEYYGNDTIVRRGSVGYPLGVETVIPANSRISLSNFYGARLGEYSVYGRSMQTGANLATFLGGETIKFDVTSIKSSEDLYYTIEYLGSGVTYEVIPSKTAVIEGDLIDFNIRTTGVSSGTTLFWCIKGVGALDFAEGSLSSNTSPVPTTATGVKEGITAAQLAGRIHEFFLKHAGRYADQEALDYYVRQVLTNEVTTVADLLTQIETNIQTTVGSASQPAFDFGNVVIKTSSNGEYGEGKVSGLIVPDRVLEGTETLIFELHTEPCVPACWSVDDFAQKYASLYLKGVSAFKAKALELLPLYNGNSSYTAFISGTSTTVYGLYQAADSASVAYWVNYALDNNYFITSPNLLNAFFSAQALSTNRILSSTKSYGVTKTDYLGCTIFADRGTSVFIPPPTTPAPSATPVPTPTPTPYQYSSWTMTLSTTQSANPLTGGINKLIFNVTIPTVDYTQIQITKDTFYYFIIEPNSSNTNRILFTGSAIPANLRNGFFTIPSANFEFKPSNLGTTNQVFQNQYLQVILTRLNNINAPAVATSSIITITTVPGGVITPIVTPTPSPSAAPVLSLAVNSAEVWEGERATWTLTAPGYANGTQIPYIISGTNIDAADFVNLPVSGNITISNGQGIITALTTVVGTDPNYYESATLSIPSLGLSKTIRILDRNTPKTAAATIEVPSLVDVAFDGKYYEVFKSSTVAVSNSSSTYFRLFFRESITDHKDKAGYWRIVKSGVQVQNDVIYEGKWIENPPYSRGLYEYRIKYTQNTATDYVLSRSVHPVPKPSIKQNGEILNLEFPSANLWNPIPIWPGSGTTGAIINLTPYLGDLFDYTYTILIREKNKPSTEKSFDFRVKISDKTTQPPSAEGSIMTSGGSSIVVSPDPLPADIIAPTYPLEITFQTTTNLRYTVISTARPSPTGRLQFGGSIAAGLGAFWVADQSLSSNGVYRVSTEIPTGYTNGPTNTRVREYYGNDSYLNLINTYPYPGGGSWVGFDFNSSGTTTITGYDLVNWGHKGSTDITYAVDQRFTSGNSVSCRLTGTPYVFLGVHYGNNSTQVVFGTALGQTGLTNDLPIRIECVQTLQAINTYIPAPNAPGWDGVKYVEKVCWQNLGTSYWQRSNFVDVGDPGTNANWLGITSRINNQLPISLKISIGHK